MVEEAHKEFKVFKKVFDCILEIRRKPMARLWCTGKNLTSSVAWDAIALTKYSLRKDEIMRNFEAPYQAELPQWCS